MFFRFDFFPCQTLHCSPRAMNQIPLLKWNWDVKYSCEAPTSFYWGMRWFKPEPFSLYKCDQEGCPLLRRSQQHDVALCLSVSLSLSLSLPPSLPLAEAICFSLPPPPLVIIVLLHWDIGISEMTAPWNWSWRTYAYISRMNCTWLFHSSFSRFM